HGVEAERDADLDTVAQRLRLLYRAARYPDDLVVDRAEALHADQQVADAGLLQLLALLSLRERDRVGDQRGEEPDLVAVGDQLIDVPPDRRLAALDVDRGVAVLVAQVVADGLRLLEIHEGMLGMVLLLDPVEEVAEVAADVARLSEPHDPAPGEQLLAGLEVAGRSWMVRRARAAGVGCSMPVPRLRRGMPLHGHLPGVLRIPRHYEAFASLFEAVAQRAGRIERVRVAGHASFC